MHIRFADVDEDFIKNQVASGFYTNETELVRDAVRRLREEKERANRFSAAIMEGEKAIREGRTKPLTSELMEQIMEEGIARAKAGKSYFSQDAVPPHES